MSDARTEFFASGATGAKPKASRDDFFAGKVNVDDFDTPVDLDAQRIIKGRGFKGSLDPEAIRTSTFNPAVGAGEAAAQVGSGLASNVGGGLAGLLNFGWNHSPIGLLAHKLGVPEADSADVVNAITDAGTYQPRTESGQEVAGAIAGPANPLNWPGMAGGAMADSAADAGAPAWVSTGLRVAPDAIATLAGMRGVRSVSPGEAPSAAMRQSAREVIDKPSVQETLNRKAGSQSMGAAGAAVDLQKLSPALRVEVEKAVQQTGGAVNEQAMARQVQADSLPVKVPMSEGQVLGDARLISEERNARGKTPGAVEAFEGQNKALTENLRAFRDTAGEDVFSTNPVEHGDTLIGRYKAIDEARNADIGTKYEALRDAAGGEFPLDTQALQANVRAALKKQLASNNAPPDIMGAIDEAATSGKISLEEFETLRTRLSSIQRTASDGQVRHAAGVIRDQVEKLPLAPGAESLKGLADTARAAARERFQALEADPAYKAAVEDSTAPDAFVRKFVINGTRDNVAKLSEAMGPDASASQTLKVATIDHLRQAAGIDGGYNGKFSQAGYNKALRALEPKLGALVDSELAEHMQNLGDVARYSQFQPEGAFVNNSNTFVALAGDKVASLAEGAGNYAAPGMGLGTLVRERAAARAAAKKVKKSWGPGAGLTKLSELQKLKEPK